MGADHITKDMMMHEILAVFPGAQRALFSRYHAFVKENPKIVQPPLEHIARAARV